MLFLQSVIHVLPQIMQTLQANSGAISPKQSTEKLEYKQRECDIILCSGSMYSLYRKIEHTGLLHNATNAPLATLGIFEWEKTRIS